MLKYTLLLAAALTTSIATNADAVYDVAKGHNLHRVGASSNPDFQEIDPAYANSAVNGDANVTVYAPTDGNINYQDKNLDNYQDPYLTNSRAYKSNQFGNAAQPPKTNVFYSVQPATMRE